MTHRPNHNPVCSSPQDTGKRGPIDRLSGQNRKVWRRGWGLALGLLALGGIGCGTETTLGNEVSEPQASALDSGELQEFLPSSDPSIALRSAARVTQQKARRFIVPQEAVAVALYKPDAQCEAYITEDAWVARQDAMAETVKLILAEQDIPFFELTGYRLSQDPITKTVTIDLRVSRTSPRLLQSLSFCEQKHLLGSLKETLLNHPEWDIEQVEFTNRGHRLVL